MARRKHPIGSAWWKYYQILKTGEPYHLSEEEWKEIGKWESMTPENKERVREIDKWYREAQ